MTGTPQTTARVTATGGSPSPPRLNLARSGLAELMLLNPATRSTRSVVFPGGAVVRVDGVELRLPTGTTKVVVADAYDLVSVPPRRDELTDRRVLADPPGVPPNSRT